MPTKYFWWIVARDPETLKSFLIAGGNTEDEARQRGLEMLPDVDFSLRKFPTTNLQRASALLKGRRLEKGHNLKQATERLGHERSVRRRGRKRRDQNWP